LAITSFGPRDRDVSAKAGLIVVCSRGHGGITDTLLGSVSLQVLHHADCAVLVVHGPTAARWGEHLTTLAGTHAVR